MSKTLNLETSVGYQVEFSFGDDGNLYVDCGELGSLNGVAFSLPAKEVQRLLAWIQPAQTAPRHDSYDDSDSAERIQRGEWRSPRTVVVTVDKDGNKFWGELAKGDSGPVMDTTLVGRVLDRIDEQIRRGRNAGSVTVDGIEYAFVVDRRGS